MALARIPEPELMDDDEQAAAYANADFAAVNQAFVDRFVAWLGGERPARIVDLGCGPADICIRLCRALPHVRITAIDGSPAMLDQASAAVSKAGLAHRIALLRQTLPGPPPAETFDVVMSNSLLHHLHDPAVMWQEVIALAAPGARVFVVDLYRPPSREAVQAIVDEHAAGEPDVLRRDFYNSLLAAFTVVEVNQQLQAAGLAPGLHAEAISDRHMLISGRTI